MKKLIKTFLRSIGYDLYFHPLNLKINDEFQLYKVLEYLNVDIVFDVGANIGQFATNLRSVGYKGRIISFEPLSDAHHRLLMAASRDLNWQVHEPVAIGDTDGIIDINISANSVSSSLLPMLDAHRKAEVGSEYIGTERVIVTSLDSVIPHYLDGSERYFIKIDTQGFEWQVLDGATKTLAKSQGVVCELSLVALYEKQHLWLEMIERLKGLGFTLWALQKGFIDSQNGRALQLDGIFIRQ